MSKKNTSDIYVVNAIPTQQTNQLPIIHVNSVENYENLNDNLIEEYVEVEEKYCGPLSTCIGAFLFVLFWPGSLMVGYCPCDKRIVKKKVVRS